MKEKRYSSVEELLKSFLCKDKRKKWRKRRSKSMQKFIEGFLEDQKNNSTELERSL